MALSIFLCLPLKESPAWALCGNWPIEVALPIFLLAPHALLTCACNQAAPEGGASYRWAAAAAGGSEADVNSMNGLLPQILVSLRKGASVFSLHGVIVRTPPMLPTPGGARGSPGNFVL